MKILLSHLFICALLAVMTPALAKDDLKVVEYKIKAGDTLSQIMEDHGIRGIYNNMQQNQHLNPMYIISEKNGISKENWRRLSVGKTILIPFASKDKRGIASEDEVILEDISAKQMDQIIKEYIEERE